MLARRPNDFPKGNPLPSSSRLMIGLRLRSLATSPFIGLILPPRTKYLRVAMSTRRRVLAIHSSDRRTMSS